MRSEEKICAGCGRRFARRAKWARCWDQVRYCSERCRRSRPGPLDTRLETAIVDLLARRAQDASICPSEAARVVGGERWRPLMERTRAAARRLAAADRVEITQKNRRVEPSRARGPIRIRQVRR